MPPKRKAQDEGWATSAVAPSDKSIKPPKVMPAIDPQLERDFKLLPKDRKSRTSEQRKIYTRYMARQKMYERWNDGKQKNIREDISDPSALHTPICSDCGEESDAFNNTYGFQRRCTQCVGIRNDNNPDRAAQNKKSKATYNKRQKTGDNLNTRLIIFPDAVITKFPSNSSTPADDDANSDSFDTDTDETASGESSDEDVGPSTPESSKRGSSKGKGKEKETEWRHPRLNPDDPDGPVPLPEFIPRCKDEPGATDVPFPKENREACDRYVYIVRTMDKYGIKVDWPTKIYNDACLYCGQEGIHWSLGARVVATVHGKRLYFKYGTSVGTKGEACLKCEKLLHIARGIVDRNEMYEEKYDISPQTQRLSSKLPSYQDRTLSAYSLILSLPDNSGKVAGSDLYSPTIDLTDKALVRRQIAKLSSLECSISGRKVVLETAGTRQSDKLSIDRVYSDKPYAHSKQILQATGWGMNMAMGNMDKLERRKMLEWFQNPFPGIADVVTVLQDIALNSKSLFNQEPHRSRISGLLPILVRFGYNLEESEARWNDGGKKAFRKQARRKFKEGRPGKVRMIGGEKVLDRMDWGGAEATTEQHLKVGKIRFVSSGTLCSVTGRKFIRPPPGRGKGFGLDGECDRIFDDGLYNGPNTWMIASGVNKFKASLLAFRSLSNWNALLSSRPDLFEKYTKEGLKLTAAHYIREELAKV
ncbi:hypothetical protein JCM3765_001066 [Sporobolomyces pararoseus]